MPAQITDYISVSDYAAYASITPQHVYNLIRSGAVGAIQFNRGKMVGWLIEKPADYDNWLSSKQV